MMLFPVLLSNLQRLSTAFEKKKNTQNAVFISVLSNLNRARDVAKRPGDVCSATTEAERRPRTFEPRRGSKFEVSAAASVDYTVRSISTPFSSIAFKSSSNASSSVIRTSKALIGQMLIIESVPILLVG